MLVVQAGQLDPADADLTRGEGVEAGDAVHEGGLARPGGAHDGAELAAGKVEGHAVQRPHLGGALAVDLGGVDDRGGHPRGLWALMVVSMWTVMAVLRSVGGRPDRVGGAADGAGALSSVALLV